LHKECPEETNADAMPSCCNCTLRGEKPYPASQQGCSHAKGELQGRRAQWAPRGSTGRTFFSMFTLPEQSFAAALCQDTQYQEPQTSQTDGKSFRPPSSSSGHNRISRKQGSQYRLPVRLTVTC
jgi:hypothetical protein